MIKESLDKIKAGSGGVDLSGANTTVVDGSRISLDELVMICNTMSFLAPKRLVIVNGLLARFNAQERKSDRRRTRPVAGDWEALPDYVKVMPESTVLVLVDAELSKGNLMLKKLAPVAEVRACAPLSLKGPELSKWISDRVSANGGSISPQALRLLRDTIGNNLWVLANEIAKLCLYAGNRRIEEKDVRSLVGFAKESNVFQMVDAIVERRFNVAARLAHRLESEGAVAPYLLFMITRQFRMLIQARDMIERKLPLKKIGEQLGVNSEFVLEKTVEQARRYSMTRLKEVYRRLLAADISIKTGAMEGELALDMLIADLCR